MFLQGYIVYSVSDAMHLPVTVRHLLMKREPQPFRIQNGQLVLNSSWLGFKIISLPRIRCVSHVWRLNR